VADVAVNKKAHYLYDVLETFEAGLVLQGTEVKSVRNRKVNLADSFARVANGEVYVYNLHISPYEQGNIHNPSSPTRPRKLLLHKREIDRLFAKTREKGLTLIPVAVYLHRGYVKVRLALAKGKRLYDRREKLKDKEAAREVRRAMRQRHRGQ